MSYQVHEESQSSTATENEYYGHKNLVDVPNETNGVQVSENNPEAQRAETESANGFRQDVDNLEVNDVASEENRGPALAENADEIADIESPGVDENFVPVHGPDAVANLEVNDVGSEENRGPALAENADELADIESPGVDETFVPVHGPVNDIGSEVIRGTAKEKNAESPEVGENYVSHVTAHGPEEIKNKIKKQ